MEVTIRKATEADYPAVLSLIKELAEFEKAPEEVTNSVGQMKQEQDLFHCYAAETDEKEIVGMAVFFFAYYTWVGKSLYLDDIYVKKKYRGQKIGTKLFEKVIAIAKKEDCKRMRWQVLDWNKDAIEFYEKYGATIDKEWYNCDFDEKDIKQFE